MIAEVATLLATGWAAAAGLQLGLWLVSLRTRNAAIVDVGWAGSFSLMVGVFLASGSGAARDTWPMAAMVIGWSVRLSLHLIRRGAITGEEEGRYQELRRRWSPRANGWLFVFFQAQALLAAVLAIAMVIPFTTAPTGPAVLRWLGLGLALVGLIGESVADGQLARFRRAPEHRGRVCDVGLWSVSRHPNYFFEIVVWCGFAAYSMAFAGGVVAAAGPLLVAASILRVTGIPATEEQAIRSRGDAYRRYQAEVSALIPWFRKRGSR